MVGKWLDEHLDLQGETFGILGGHTSTPQGGLSEDDLRFEEVADKGQRGAR